MKWVWVPKSTCPEPETKSTKEVRNMRPFNKSPGNFNERSCKEKRRVVKPQAGGPLSDQKPSREKRFVHKEGKKKRRMGYSIFSEIFSVVKILYCLQERLCYFNGWLKPDPLEEKASTLFPRILQPKKNNVGMVSCLSWFVQELKGKEKKLNGGHGRVVGSFLSPLQRGTSCRVYDDDFLSFKKSFRSIKAAISSINRRRYYSIIVAVLLQPAPVCLQMPDSRSTFNSPRPIPCSSAYANQRPHLLHFIISSLFFGIKAMDSQCQNDASLQQDNDMNCVLDLRTVTKDSCILSNGKAIVQGNSKDASHQGPLFKKGDGSIVLESEWHSKPRLFEENVAAWCYVSK
ncbi:hypothetical protein L1887_28223 [Cichorium endivia]|nr:hypothetical protein L1887_28223 [Cichorium endivia]